MTHTLEELIPDYIQGLPAYVAGKPVEEVEQELKIHAVKLASNENPLGPSPKAMEAARRALEKLSIATTHVPAEAALTEAAGE